MLALPTQVSIEHHNDLPVRVHEGGRVTENILKVLLHLVNSSLIDAEQPINQLHKLAKADLGICLDLLGLLEGEAL